MEEILKHPWDLSKIKDKEIAYLLGKIEIEILWLKAEEKTIEERLEFLQQMRKDTETLVNDIVNRLNKIEWANQKESRKEK